MVHIRLMVLNQRREISQSIHDLMSQYEITKQGAINQSKKYYKYIQLKQLKEDT